MNNYKKLPLVLIPLLVLAGCNKQAEPEPDPEPMSVEEGFDLIYDELDFDDVANVTNVRQEKRQAFYSYAMGARYYSYDVDTVVERNNVRLWDNDVYTYSYRSVTNNVVTHTADSIVAYDAQQYVKDGFFHSYQITQGEEGPVVAGGILGGAIELENDPDYDSFEEKYFEPAGNQAFGLGLLLNYTDDEVMQEEFYDDFGEPADAKLELTEGDESFVIELTYTWNIDFADMFGLAGDGARPVEYKFAITVEAGYNGHVSRVDILEDCTTKVGFNYGEELANPIYLTHTFTSYYGVDAVEGALPEEEIVCNENAVAASKFYGRWYASETSYYQILMNGERPLPQKLAVNTSTGAVTVADNYTTSQASRTPTYDPETDTLKWYGSTSRKNWTASINEDGNLVVTDGTNTTVYYSEANWAALNADSEAGE